MDLYSITDALLNDLRPLRFGPSITHVYNPLEYARKPHWRYLERYAWPPKEVILLGMNPGPWGMAQTGVPFGEVKAVKEWLRIEGCVSKPAGMHPKRPVEGFACKRSEISGSRLWGWARDTFGTPERFFSRFFVVNYCPLVFFEGGGRNITPDNLAAADKPPLFAVCDLALRRTVEWMEARFVVGVGNFAEKCAHRALTGLGVTVGRMTHPSPANPRANRGWGSLVMSELGALGIRI